MDERFLKAVEKVLVHEGGYVSDPHDPGGETKYGISKRTYPKLDIKHLTRDVAISIYFRDWWQRYGYEMIADDALAAKVFDFAVNMGPSRAHKLLQEAVNRTSPAGLSVDGQLGPLSIKAVNDHYNSSLLLAEFRLGAISFYASLKNAPRYLLGWVRRALD